MIVRQIKRIAMRGLTGLLVALYIIIGASACSEKDNPTLFTSLQEQIVGMWYAENDWRGIIEDAETPFTKVAQAYEFNADGTGSWYKLYTNAGYDVLGKENCSFRYQVYANGTVTVALSDYNGIPSEWRLMMEDGSLKLTDDTPQTGVTTTEPEPQLTLAPATEAQTAFAKDLLSDDLRFLADWEHCSTVRVNGLENPVATPWESENQSSIPYSVSKQCKRSQGWEMAFCALNNTATPDIRYFGLYNKWTGTLRVFHYIVDATGYGNEIDYQVWMGTDRMAVNEAPYYNALEYGIPASHQPGTSLSEDVQLFGSSRQRHPFMTWVTPYRIYEQALISGWYCFDLDMSGYVPEGEQWRNVQDDVKLMIVPQFRSKQDITLIGSLTGNLSGTQSPERIIQTGGGNMFSGVCGVLDMISGKASSSISGSNAYASLMKNSQSALGQVLNPIKYWGGFGCSMASALLNFTGKMLEEPASYDTIPGKIDLKMDAQLDLSGTITNFVSANQPICRVTLTNITRTNGSDGHFGRGVWSLADDPVVYVDTQDIMGSDGTTFLNPYYPNTYSNLGSEKDCQFRLVWFLDPTSVKVNINRDLFPDIKDVNVTTVCGIYPQRKMGYTSEYRKFMMLGDMPTFKLSTNANQAITETTQSPKLVRVTPSGLLNYEGADPYETSENSSTVELAGFERYAVTAIDARTHKPVDSVRIGMRSYGRVIKELDKTMMVTPQLFVPFGGLSSQDPVIPDLVVSVTVTFESNGSTYQYSKCFIPKVKLIKRTETLERYESLKAFADKAKAQQPTGTLANDGSTPVYSPDADKLMGKTLNMLSLVQSQASVGQLTVTRATEGNYDNASAQNLFDGDPSTPWYVKRADMQGGLWFVEFKANSPISPKSYLLRTRSQRGVDGRYPKSWKLMAKASASDQNWIVIASAVNDMSITGYDESYRYSISNAGPWQYFRYEVSANRGNEDVMQLGDFELFE